MPRPGTNERVTLDQQHTTLPRLSASKSAPRAVELIAENPDSWD